MMHDMRSLNAAWRTGWWRGCGELKRRAGLIEISACLGKFAMMEKYASHPLASGFVFASKVALSFRIPWLDLLILNCYLLYTFFLYVLVKWSILYIWIAPLDLLSVQIWLKKIIKTARNTCWKPYVSKYQVVLMAKMASRSHFNDLL